MPVYTFRCAGCGDVDGTFAMATVPSATACPHCGRSASRRITAGRLLRGGGTVGRLLEATARTAHEPPVVSGPPPQASPPTAQSTNPLHAKLPRP